MRFPKTWISLTFGGMLATIAANADALSFDEALARIEVNSHVLEAARLEIAEAQAELAKARSRRMPTVALEARATRLDSPLDVDVLGALPARLMA